MTNDFRFVKIVDDVFSRKLLYKNKKKTSITYHTDEEWKKILLNFSKKFGIDVPKQGALSDEKYNELLMVIPENCFFLIDGDNLVGEIEYTIDEDGYAFLDYMVFEEYRGQGFATYMCRLLEEELMNDSSIKGLFIADYTPECISSKIAEKLGYTRIRNRCYKKDNPNYVIGKKI